MKRTIVAIALAVTVGSASAVIPDSGWYFNSAESGRGFNIEIQNNVLFMAGFLYDTTGKPIWIVSGGPMSSDHTYSGAALQTSNGQFLGGSYHAATGVPFGTASVTFPTTQTANITVNGYSFTVTREIFGFDFTSIAEPLLGEFSFVEGTAGAYFGNRIVFTGTQVLNGSLWAVGHTTDNTARTAVGQYAASLQEWTILLDSSTSYYDFFTFTFTGLNFVEGADYTYLKGTNPAGSLPALGFRTKSAQAAAGLNAPGSTKQMVIGSDSYSAIKAAAQTTNQLDQSHVATLRAMENMLQGARQ